MSIADLPTLYTTEEVAEYLRVGKSTVNRARRARLLGSIPVGIRPRYTLEHIQAYMAKQEVPAK